VVSAVSTAGGTRYRVVSADRPGADAVPVAPSLEEGYVALMRGLSVVA
jgi:ABC-2 type transport system ATP-binding protein